MRALFLFLLILLAGSNHANVPERINRKAVVTRHNIKSDRFSKRSPAQVGNGEIAFGVDLTGLQTFVPFKPCRKGWHSISRTGGVEMGISGDSR